MTALDGVGLASDECAELSALCPAATVFEEAGLHYILLPQLRLPAGCTPAAVDALLCPHPRDGYAARLFFASIVQSPQPRNWNGQDVRIGDRNWFAFSWRVPDGKHRLLQLVGICLEGLR